MKTTYLALVKPHLLLNDCRYPTAFTRGCKKHKSKKFNSDRTCTGGLRCCPYVRYIHIELTGSIGTLDVSDCVFGKSRGLNKNKLLKKLCVTYQRFKH